MNTILYPLLGTLFTFLMTTLGSALVFFFKDEIKDFYQQLFLGFAAGIMIAASVWSLLIPSMEMAEANGQNSALILGGGFIIGALFLLFLDHVIPHQHLNEDKPEGPKSMLGKNTMLVLAVTLHNIPEGFAVGLTFAIAASNSSITFASALALALGIGLQNLPEGAAISLPLKQEGMSRTKAFVCGPGPLRQSSAGSAAASSRECACCLPERNTPDFSPPCRRWILLWSRPRWPGLRCR